MSRGLPQCLLSNCDNFKVCFLFSQPFTVSSHNPKLNNMSGLHRRCSISNKTNSFQLWQYLAYLKRLKNLMSVGPCVVKNQLDATYYFIALLIASTCFGHYCAHHQELLTIMLITTLVVSFLVCCRLEVRCS